MTKAILWPKAKLGLNIPFAALTLRANAGVVIPIKIMKNIHVKTFIQRWSVFLFDLNSPIRYLPRLEKIGPERLSSNSETSVLPSHSNGGTSD